MKFRCALAAVSLLLISTSCSSVGTRAPSSEQSAEVTLEKILSMPDPRSEARGFVERLLRIQLRAHGWMLETDKIFEQATAPVELFEQSSYRKLLIARPLVERIQDQIVDLYKDAHDSKDEKAALVVQGVHDALRHAHHNAGERILLNDLMRALRDARGPNHNPHSPVAPLEGDELSLAAAQASAEIRQLVDQLPESDDVKKEVESQEADLANELKDLSPGREPQSLNVFPTAAKNGNIDGFTFPRGTWAVTFDDGPNPQITSQDLANLQSSGNRATFFWLAKNLILYPEIVKKVMAAGMPVENHSWTHPQLDNAADLARLHTNLDKEINQSTAEDVKAYGGKPRFFRCPYGAGFNNPVIRGMIARLGMIHVRWNVDSLDWKDNNPATVQARVEQQMRVNGRGIILFHDIHTAALTVVPRLFSEFKGKLRFVTIPQIVDELNGVKPGHDPVETPPDASEPPPQQ